MLFKPCTFPKKGISSGLALGQLLGNEFWVLIIFCLIRVFLYARGLGLQYPSDQIFKLMMQFTVNACFLLGGGGIWIAEVSHTGAAYLSICFIFNNNSAHQGLGEFLWLTTLHILHMRKPRYRKSKYFSWGHIVSRRSSFKNNPLTTQVILFTIFSGKIVCV